MVDELPKLYGSTDGKTRLVKSLYGSVNGIARPISKLYGSVSGRSKLIFQAQAGGDGDFDPVDSNNVDLDNLSNIVKAGMASEYLKVGDILQIPWADGTKVQRRVLGFGDRVVKIGDVEQVVPAIQMDDVYLFKTPTVYYGSSAISVVYPSSYLRAFINSTVTNIQSSEFLECLGATKVSTVARVVNGQASILTSYDKIFAPSVVELGAKHNSYSEAQAGGEGVTPDFYLNNPLLSREVEGEGYPRIFWTRSLARDRARYMFVGDAGDILYGKQTSSYYVLPTYNFIGKY